VVRAFAIDADDPGFDTIFVFGNVSPTSSEPGKVKDSKERLLAPLLVQGSKERALASLLVQGSKERVLAPLLVQLRDSLILSLNKHQQMNIPVPNNLIFKDIQ